MNEQDDLREVFEILAQRAPREAGPFVRQNVLERFRERQKHKTIRNYLAAVAAVAALAIGFYAAHGRPTIGGNLPVESNQIAGFITLPYGQSGVPLEQPVIVRVNIPVSDLPMIGVPITPQAGSKQRVNADLLIGQDGVARAVRFVE